MLTNFFQLNGTPQTITDDQLITALAGNDTLRGMLFGFDQWPATVRQIKSKTFNNVSFSKTKIYQSTFTSCRFEDCLFIGSRFEEVEFHRCEFINCNFYKTEFEKCYLDPRSIELAKIYRKTAANIGVQLYQRLYENASKTRQPDFEYFADYEFRRWKRWQLPFDHTSGKISWFAFVWGKVKSFTYECVAGFGYKPWRFIRTTIGLFIIVSVLNGYLLVGALRVDDKVVSDLSFADSIFYTFSLMTSLGFSTIVPTVWYAKLLAVSESLFGIGWLGLFTSLLVKRFIR